MNAMTKTLSTPLGFTQTALEAVSDPATLWAWNSQINHLNARYAQVLDDAQFKEWPHFFIDCAHYKIQARENHERGLPLCIVDLESQGMMKDRIYGITETIFHAPYYTRHVVSQSLILGVQSPQNQDNAVQACLSALTEMMATDASKRKAPTLIVSTSNYCVFRTKPGKTSEVFNVGRYLDHWIETDEGLKIASRHCIYDSEMILNSLIYPI